MTNAFNPQKTETSTTVRPAASGSGDAVLACRQLVRDFREGDKVLHVLRGADLEIHAGERVAIICE